jgi:hypothetical protein
MFSTKKPQRTVNPEKELRFTRSHQAILFWTLATVFACAAMWLFLAATPYLNPLEWESRRINSVAWGFIPVFPALLCAWVAVHLTRHAFIILTPLGIEVFPFWMPKKNLTVFFWAEIEKAEVDEAANMLIIYLAGTGDSRVYISMDPIRKNRRPLLKRAIDGRMKFNAQT